MDQIFYNAIQDLKCAAINPDNVIFFNEEDKAPAKVAFLERCKIVFNNAYLAYQARRVADMKRAKTALVERAEMEREFIQAVFS
jgi:hypothetical protein